MEDEIETAIAVYADDHIDPPLSHPMVGLVLVFEFCLLIAALVQHARETARGRQAEAAYDPATPLIRGARYVSGTVELSRGTEVAVRVKIHQTGREKRNKNHWSHSWREDLRDVTANPFYLSREDGSRVRVEPDPSVLLVDAVDQMLWTKHTERVRIAELTPGEHAIVEGYLSQGPDPESLETTGYRGTSRRTWVMRRRGDERLHVSTERLAERHWLKVRQIREGIVAVVAALVCSGLLFATYFARIADGELTTAEVRRQRHYVTRDSKGRDHHHYEVDLSIPLHDGATVSSSEEVDSSDYLRLAVGTRLDYLHVPHWPRASSIGRASSVSTFLWIGGVLAAFLGFFVYARRAGARRWYEGKLNESGKGRLPIPPGTRPRLED